MKKTLFYWTMAVILIINLTSCGSWRPSSINHRDDNNLGKNDNSLTRDSILTERYETKQRIKNAYDTLFLAATRRGLENDNSFPADAGNNSVIVTAKRYYKNRAVHYYFTRPNEPEMLEHPEILFLTIRDDPDMTKTISLPKGPWTIVYEELDNWGRWRRMGSVTKILTGKYPIILHGVPW